MRWLVLVLACGCHIGWSTHQGVPPRPNSAAKVLVHAPDDASKRVALAILAKDPTVTVVELDPALATSVEAGCQAARAQQADYYVGASLSSQYDAKFVCTAYGGSILDKNQECSEGHYENQHSTGTFKLTMYGSQTCQEVRSLGLTVTAHAAGEEAESKPASLEWVTSDALQRKFYVPSQIEVGADGTADAPDGYYALYRGHRFRGFALREGGSIRMLHCCDTPSAGDRLVGRGMRRMLETAVNGVGASFTLDGKRYIAPGVGVHVRYHPLDAGLRFAFGFDVLGSASAKVNVFVFQPEIGWGFRPSSAIALSANAGLGWSGATQVVESMNDATPRSVTWQAHANLRLLTFFATWWYLGADVGYVYSGTFEDWEGDGFSGARNITVRTPIARAWLGFDL